MSSSSSSSSAAAGYVWITVETDNAGEPSGNIVASSNAILATDIGTTAVWKDFTFSSPFSLNPATKYWIVLHGSYTKSDTNYIAWRSDNTDAAFANGNVAYWVDGETNAWSAAETHDFMFKVRESVAGYNYNIDGANIKLDSGVYSAVYYTSIKDIGYVCDARILIESVVTSAQATAWDSDALRQFNSDETLRFTGAESSGSISFKIRTSEDNVTWTDWEDWIIADYTCRYFQVKATLTRNSLTNDLIWSSFIIKVDLPDVDETGSGTVAVAGDGCAVTFTKTFHTAPSVNIDITSGDAYVHKFSVIPSTTGFTVKLYELDGTAATGTFTYHAHGV